MDSGQDAEAGFAELLADRIDQARRQLDALTASVADLRESRSLTFADDEHDPDGSTSSWDQARDEALLRQTAHTLDQLGAARQRLVDGSFGRCESCRQPIAEPRLRARPEARFCIACAARGEAAETRGSLR